MVKIIILVLIPLLFLSACGDDEKDQAPPEIINPEEGDPALGQVIFNSTTNRCSECHGTDGTGGTQDTSIIDATSTQIQSNVRSGPGVMPAFSQTDISTEDLNHLVAYILDL